MNTEEKREYYKSYRIKNKDKLNKYGQQYRYKNKEKIKEYRFRNRERLQIKDTLRHKKLYQNNKEKYREKARIQNSKYRQEHRVQVNATARKYYQKNRITKLERCRQYNKKHYPERRAYVKNWVIQNRDKVAEYNKKQRTSNPDLIKRCQKNSIKKKPEVYCNIRIRTLSKKIEEKINRNESYLDNKLLRMRFAELTKLIYADKLPKYCEICKSTTSLAIHHKNYDYPILKENIIRLCRPCHNKSHNHNIDAENMSLTERSKIRRITRKQYCEFPALCELCKKSPPEIINHQRYRLPIIREDIQFLCKKCHHHYHSFKAFSIESLMKEQHQKIAHEEQSSQT